MGHAFADPSRLTALPSLPPSLALAARRRAILSLATRLSQDRALFERLLRRAAVEAGGDGRIGLDIRRRLRARRAEGTLGPWWHCAHQELFALAIAARRFGAAA
ncbi:hypothetical protein F11_19390 [Rhodospirillum rubrum F11]|uniref:Uncharacterized protein n=1 Tax=Rhodospirillum rubrum (strain ATCC 11170 / ATH 1.1.1 / DSM 467 / LMG 4362 / NCIMB 8255 / S1) TaxID=269796 RepID=Q2RMR0_RHORT|nr:hypothetical protein [Rhodospirillum rubrum]ABC24585.1 hypothetical protein Rru_A3791 [Rhodospirillum rubrum ATCC 11170]AEO50338.1 hypothetical protein F11_19390 [Rhodospirillum rubrum F11]MBK5956317.1 hypothetical protein [Rhodospirillum rubrum]QXG80499.1 hypothetical protein KUL73_19540 [Rhodospirillum rubrum]